MAREHRREISPSKPKEGFSAAGAVCKGCSGFCAEFFESSGHRYEYKTNHVWGVFRPLLTEKATLAERLSGILTSDMPKTFQDAVMLTRLLGVQYLWIDSLCIIQDDATDWEIESANMAKVYSNALLVISADDAKDARDGFLRPRGEGAYSSVEIPYHDAATNKNGNIYARKKWLDIGDYEDNIYVFDETIEEFAHTGERSHSRSLLNTRAWAFQERLLSPRTLHYSSSEMAFECRNIIQCECSPRPRREMKSRLFKNQGIAESSIGRSDWMTILDSFTDRNLTFDTDRLPALAGVAAAMEPYTADDYICGLWRQEFRTGLLWEIHHRSSPPARRHRQYYAPSWSWASVNGSTVHGFGRYNGWSESQGEWAEVLSIDIEKTTKNPYGPGRGSVLLRGYIGLATVSDFQRRPPLIRLGAAGTKGGEDIIFNVDIEEKPEVVQGGEVYIFVVTSKPSKEDSTVRTDMSCLVLLKAGEESPNIYRRVGHAEGFYGQNFNSWDQHFQRETVRLI
ncbi:hypothetical protein SAPIO_CDS2120 [Scedosporium apiospermum]|uniref:Heterokaryon incompatibility domain-containing protein n=1 Tax=Pseudallescheria apiosperma TaxID=563466 RepID=A0A084GDA4_PSEDA|nr:uncharacterized protein SAPIO_CDS2120 [Scedosporium apiospermum]KEZ45316.1 hypothetical protein SAPIO_CDS2120 [Scedosporium apiospermum]